MARSSFLFIGALCALSPSLVDAMRISRANMAANLTAPENKSAYISAADLLAIADNQQYPLMDKFFEQKCPDAVDFMWAITAPAPEMISQLKSKVKAEPGTPVIWPILPNPLVTDVITMAGILNMQVGLAQGAFEAVNSLKEKLEDLKHQWVELGSKVALTTPEALQSNEVGEIEPEKLVAKLITGVTEEQLGQDVVYLRDDNEDVVALVLRVKKMFNLQTKGNRYVVISAEDRHYPVLVEAKAGKKGKGLQVSKDILLGGVVPAESEPTVLATEKGIKLPWTESDGRTYEWYDKEAQAESFQAFAGKVLGDARQLHAEDRWNEQQITAVVSWRDWHCQCSKHNFVTPKKGSTPAKLNWNEFLGYWECMYQQAFPGATAEHTSPTEESAPTGDCSQDDRSAMEAVGGGNAAGSLPGIAAACGADSWGFSGWKPDKFVSCLTGKIPLSETCATCFSEAGNYGFQNCKMACMKSWCGHKCMSCNENYKEAFNACTGIAVPPAEEC